LYRGSTVGIERSALSESRVVVSEASADVVTARPLPYRSNNGHPCSPHLCILPERSYTPRVDGLRPTRSRVRRFCGSWSLVLSAAAVAMGLLKGLDPLLTADLLYVLRAMGHGDELVVCDCNFPATTTAEATTTKKLVSLPGADCPQAIDAICSVLPLDFFVPDPAHFMSPQEGVELPPAGKKVHATVQAALDKHCGVKMQPLDRFAFYERAKKAFAVVQTMERRPYGCYILKKGVVGPDGNDLKP
ncbi:unnamed protein product, partial [Prorocentrum cordatum]